MRRFPRHAPEVRGLHALVRPHGRRHALDQLGAEVHHHQPVDQFHHEVHVVLDDQDRHALLAQLAQQVGERHLLLAAQAGGRLVEHQQHRVGGQRARDLEDALRAQRQAAGQFVRAVAEADAVQLALRLLQDLALLACGPAAARPRARRSACANGRRARRCRAGSCAGAASRAGRCAPGRDARPGAAACRRCRGPGSAPGPPSSAACRSAG